MKPAKKEQSVEEFRKLFPDAAACFEALKALRWKDGFTCCPGAKAYWLRNHGKWECAGCGHKTSVTTGTIFEGSANRITTWFEAIWHFTATKDGCSALELQQLLMLPNGDKLVYSTAHSWRKKICGLFPKHQSPPNMSPKPFKSRVTLGLQRLRVSGKKYGQPGLVLVAMQPKNDKQSPDANGVVRLRSLADESSKAVIRAVKSMVASDAQVITETWEGFKPLKEFFPNHAYLQAAKLPDGAQRTHLSFELSDLITGTFRGAVRDLNPYLNEFGYRWNRKVVNKKEVLFQTVLTWAANPLARRTRRVPSGR